MAGWQEQGRQGMRSQGALVSSTGLAVTLASWQQGTEFLWALFGGSWALGFGGYRVLVVWPH